MNNHVAEPIKEILANINMGIKAGIKKAKKKPLDSLLDSVNDVYVKTDTYFAKLRQENEALDEDREKLWKHNAEQQVKIDKLKRENFKLKDELEIAEDTLEELKELCCPDQLADLHYILKRKKEDKENKKEMSDESRLYKKLS